MNEFDPVEQDPRAYQRRALQILSHVVRTQHDGQKLEAATTPARVRHAFVVLSPKR